MNIPPEVVVHETGHLVVGLCLGLDEQGIAFRPFKIGEAAGAWCKALYRTPKKAIVRSLSGLLTHLKLLPDTIEPHLRLAYANSIIIDRDHPNYQNLTEEERQFLSGAQTDMSVAWSYASKLHRENGRKALSCMRDSERKARLLIEKYETGISQVVADIAIWAKEPERESDALLLYPPRRALSVIGK